MVRANGTNDGVSKRMLTSELQILFPENHQYHQNLSLDFTWLDNDFTTINLQTCINSTILSINTKTTTTRATIMAIGKPTVRLPHKNVIVTFNPTISLRKLPWIYVSVQSISCTALIPKTNWLPLTKQWTTTFKTTKRTKFILTAIPIRQLEPLNIKLSEFLELMCSTSFNAADERTSDILKNGCYDAQIKWQPTL